MVRLGLAKIKMAACECLMLFEALSCLKRKGGEPGATHL